MQQRIFLNRQEVEKIVLAHLQKTQRIPSGVNPRTVSGYISSGPAHPGVIHPPHANKDESLLWAAYVEWDEKLPEGE